MKTQWSISIATIAFLLLSFWWLYNNLILGNQNIRYDSYFDFGEIYGYMAILGGVSGLLISRKWGGLKSVIGKSVFMFAIGLFAQEFGQLFYALYNDIYKTPGPYPSLGDLGYFGSIPLYIYGVWLLAKASGVNFSLKSVQHKIQGILVPLLVLGLSYYFFLQGYKFDWSHPLTILLDFGYPLGQAIYVSLALLTYLLSRSVLGGVMKPRILMILMALCIQYLSDFTFLYQSHAGTWTVGGVNDYMYLIAYFVMTLALLEFSVESIKNNLESKV